MSLSDACVTDSQIRDAALKVVAAVRGNPGRIPYLFQESVGDSSTMVSFSVWLYFSQLFPAW